MCLNVASLMWDNIGCKQDQVSFQEARPMKEEYKYMIGAKDPEGIIRAYALGDNKKATWKHCEKMLTEYLEGKKNIPFHRYKWADYTIEQVHPETN